MIPCDHCPAPAVHHAPDFMWDKERQHRCDKHRENDLSQQKHLAMSTLPIGLQRLTQLAEHLEKGQLGHEVFDFGTYNNAGGPQCGTAGCAIGECPIVWPDKWYWDKNGKPVWHGCSSTIVSGMAFFQIEDEEYEHIFLPNCQKPEKLSGNYLSRFATRYAVANNIRAFIAIKAATTAYAPTDSEGAGY